MAYSLQATAKNTIVTYSCQVGGIFIINPIILSGFGKDVFLDIDDVENVVYEIGADGVTQVSIKPAFITGKMTFLPTSTAVRAIQTIQTAQNTAGVGVPGTLLVANATGGWTYTLENFVVMNPFKGWELSPEKVKDVPLMFSAALPTQNIIGDVVQVLSALSALI